MSADELATRLVAAAFAILIAAVIVGAVLSSGALAELLAPIGRVLG